MTAFIVISTDNRLSGLADGIEKCLPLNPAVHTYLSTGKVEEQSGRTYYHYNLYGDKDKDYETRSFHDLVLNQVAAFRKVYGQTELLNILTLENPMTEEEFSVIDGWMWGLGDVFKDDKNILLHRAVFTYDMNEPWDVAVHIPSNVLAKYLKSKDSYEFKDSSGMIVIGNRNMWGGAVSLKKDGHDFKMPRVLADFMMLLSSDNNAYGVLGTINTSPEKCIALGWAESMYYFPDVREYYEHADRRFFYEHILNESDQTADFQKDMDAMDIEKYPVGLLPRKERLGAKYNDVPFDRDINLHNGSADHTIDCCLLEMRGLLVGKRAAEFAAKKQEIDAKMQEVEEKIAALQDDRQDNEANAEAGSVEAGHRIEELENRKLDLQMELESFEPECPEFISRQEIFNGFSAYDPNDEEEVEERKKYMDNAEKKYSKLIKYVTGKDFNLYLETGAKDQNGLTQTAEPSLADRPGCLGIFRRKKKTEREEVKSPDPAQIQSSKDNVKKIRQQLKLKIEFRNFLHKCESIEKKMEEEKEWCKNFKLTDHSNHYYHLINLDELKKYQEEKFEERFHTLLVKWNAEEPKDRTLTRLEKLLHEATIDYTYYYRFIDWSAPFDFVSKTDDEHLKKICDRLYVLSSPYVHYETITETATNDIVIYLYSDISNIKNRFDDVRHDITDNTNVTPYHSTHIASKLCYLQFLPLDKDKLELLVQSFE